MNGVEKIFDKKKLVGIIFRKNIAIKESTFLTDPANEIQVGIHTNKEDSFKKAHSHGFLKLGKNHRIQEFVYIQKGDAHIYFKDNNQQDIADRILKSGDSVLILEGYHQFLFMKGSKVIEIKQGPYE